MEERNGFESRLARRVSGRRGRKLGWAANAGIVVTLFLLLALNASSMAAPHTVIKIGSQTSNAQFLGAFEGKSQVLMLGTSSTADWVCIKIPFKGRLSELTSISFSDSILQSGGSQSLEPYVVLKLSENRFLVSHPHYSYDTAVWAMPSREWQSRDLVSQGKWAIARVETQSMVVPLSSWISITGDRYIVGLSMFVGPWEMSEPFLCYVGDVAVNGVPIDISNAARAMGTIEDLSPAV